MSAEVRTRAFEPEAPAADLETGEANSEGRTVNKTVYIAASNTNIQRTDDATSLKNFQHTRNDHGICGNINQLNDITTSTTISGVVNEKSSKDLNDLRRMSGGPTIRGYDQ